MNDPMSIDLKSLKKSMPRPAPVSVEPAFSPPTEPERSGMPPPPPPRPPAPRIARPYSAPNFSSKSASGLGIPVGWIIYGVLGLIAITILGWGIYYIYVNVWTKSPFGPTPGNVATQQASADAATSSADLTEAEILRKVGDIFVLPSDETPALAKVSDPAALSNQAFFKQAKTGDIVLMYAKAQRAILYDPSINKIVEVAPITTQSSSTPTAAK